MNWTQSQEGSFEKIWGQYFLSRNSRYETNFSGSGTITQMRGLTVFFITRQTLLTEFNTFKATGYPSGKLAGQKPSDPLGGNQFGTAIHCLAAAAGAEAIASSSIACGVIDDDILCGRTAGTGIWVTVQHYGHHDAVAFDAAYADGGIMFPTDGGLLGVMPKEAFSTYPKLRGTISINTAAAGPVFIALDGTDTPDSTWGVTKPSVDLAASVDPAGGSSTNLGAKVPPQAPLIGFKFNQAAVSIGGPMYPDTILRGQAFISCLGMSVGH